VYRRSIRRPGIGELNPAIDFSDPYNIRSGNPALLPSLTENFDFNFGSNKGKFYWNASLGYNIVKDIYQLIRTLLPESKTRITYENIYDRKEYEASLWGGYAFSKKLRINMSAGYTYNVYSIYDRTVNRYRNGGSFYTGMNGNYILTDVLSTDINMRFSSVADAQGRARSTLTMNWGLQQKLFGKRVLVTVNLIDPFRQQQVRSFTYGSNFVLENVAASQTRNLRFAVSYNIGMPKPRVGNVLQKRIAAPARKS
jgi:hypothetical protein